MNKISKKFDRFTDGIEPRLEKILIYTNDVGQYVLFERYTISRVDYLFKVERVLDGYTIDFGNLRNAASWCILDHHNKIVEARRVGELDAKLDSIKAEINIHKHLKSCHDIEWSQIQRDKLLEAIARSKRFKWELDKYIILAKTCQERGYKNESTRIA